MSDSRRFHSEEYIEAYRERGEFPRIHDDIGKVVEKYGKDYDRCIDLGACIGLLSARLAERCGKSLVVGVEANENYLSRAIQHERIVYKHLAVTDDTLQAMGDIIREHDIKLIVARRVFSEIGKSVVTKLASVFKENGVEMIILEGRVRVPNPTNELYDADAEVNALRVEYKPIFAKKDCRVLVLR
jgi:signal recognition particle GTPase